MPNLNLSYDWEVQKCNEPNIGYSQAYRNQQTVNGITYYDCSSFVWYALIAGGFDVLTAYQQTMGYAYSGNAIVTDYMVPFLIALGFVEVPLTGEWKPGNIVCLPGVHCEMVHTGGMGEGITMGAHSDGLPLADQVSINNYYNHGADFYSHMLEYQGGVTPTGKHKMPLMMYLKPWWKYRR